MGGTIKVADLITKGLHLSKHRSWNVSGVFIQVIQQNFPIILQDS